MMLSILKVLKLQEKILIFFVRKIKIKKNLKEVDILKLRGLIPIITNIQLILN
jgi:hypothetical protein